MVKKGVQFYGMQPEMVFCHIEIKDVFNTLGIVCVSTSIVGKKHKKRSLHPPGYAVDYRTKHIKGSTFGASREQKIKNLMSLLRANVPQCDFVFEHEGEAQEHIHAEYDPKDDVLFQHHKELYRKSGSWPRGYNE